MHTTSIVTSRQHAFVRRCRDVAARRQADAAVLLDGEHVCEAALEAGVPIEGLLSSGAAPRLLARAAARGVAIYHGTDSVLDAASPVRTSSGIVGVAAWAPTSLAVIFAAPAPLVLGLVDVQDPGNVGAVIRSAEAFGATGVVAIGATADPAGWKAVRGAMGSTFRIAVARADLASTLAAAAARHVRLAATDASGGTPLEYADLRPPILILLGSEGEGLPTDVMAASALRLSIPMCAPVESLNVATSAALVLYEARRQRGRVRSGAAVTDLFGDDDEARAAAGALPGTPLAERMRPRTLDEYVGQQHLMGPGRPLRQAISSGKLHSLILWGPPGTGKTTLARLLAAVAGAEFVAFSAVTSGIKEIREMIGAAERLRAQRGRRTILFIDEIHRFNKAQQDAFLPHVEGGTILLVGATTENPSFEVNSALLSRSKVYVLEPLTTDEVATILTRALADDGRGLGALQVVAEEAALIAIAVYANGDARVALNLLDQAVASLVPDETGRRRLDAATLSDLVARRALLYDKSGDEHYNLISALHKSIRNSDADAAMYWLARMVEAGEDPLYVVRRLVRFASEDIGNADPRALEVALAAKEAVHFLGMPEANTALAQCVTYLSALSEEQRGLCRIREGCGRRDARRGGAGAPAPAQCPHAADERSGVRRGLQVRARRPGRRLGDGLPARAPEGPSVLRADRSRHRGAHQGIARARAAAAGEERRRRRSVARVGRRP